MNAIDRIKAKVGKIEEILSDVKHELARMSNADSPRPKVRTMEILPSEDELQSEYERLYQQFLNREFDRIRDFARTKTKRYLAAFCNANDLPLNASKLSKDRIAEELLQWLAQRKAITQKAV